MKPKSASGGLWRALGPLGGFVGELQGARRPPERNWSPFWSRLDPQVGAHIPSTPVLQFKQKSYSASVADFGASYADLGSILGRCWAVLAAMLAVFKELHAHVAACSVCVFALDSLALARSADSCFAFFGVPASALQSWA